MNFANKTSEGVMIESTSGWKRFIDSKKEIRKISSITGCAMLTALDIVLRAFRIDFSNILSIGFSSLAVAASALFYGPLLTGLAGIIADTLGYMIHPNGPYFPGFAINAFLTGVIYGCFFYQKKITVTRVILARLCISVIINLILTPLWLNMMYGNAIFALPRIIKNIVMFPLDAWLLYIVLKGAARIKKG